MRALGGANLKSESGREKESASHLINANWREEQGEAEVVEAVEPSKGGRRMGAAAAPPETAMKKPLLPPFAFYFFFILFCFLCLQALD